MLIVLILIIMISALTVIISLLMAGDSNAFSGALVGSSDLDLFKVSKERGGKKILKWAMFSTGFTLMILAILIRTII